MNTSVRPTSAAMARGGNTASLKQMNRFIVMKLIQQSGGISRADIAEKSGLSRGGLTPIISQLLSLGLITEGESIETPNGRHPVNLHLNANWLKAISILWCRERLAVSLVAADNTIQYVSQYLFNGNETAEDIFALTIRSIEEILSANSNALILGIVVLGPGPLDAEGGRILSPANFYDWHNLSIVEPLEQRFHLPVYLENDLVGYTIAEQHLGQGRGLNSFTMLSIGDGVGAEMVIDGFIHQGSHHQVVEVGHVSLDPFGKTCSCGNQGCAEMYASVPQLCRSALNLSEDQKISDCSLLLDTVLKRASEGDERCIQALQRHVIYVGQVIITLVNLLDVETIIICDTLCKTGPEFLQALNDYVRARITGRTLFRPTVLFSSVGDGRLVGGGIYVFNRFLSGDMGSYEDVIEHNAHIVS